MNSYPFLLPPWVHSSLHLPTGPVYPALLPPSYASLDPLCHLQLRQPPGLSDETKTILRPRAVRLSDLNLLGPPPLSECSRSLNLGQVFPDARFASERGELSWKPPTFQISQPAQLCTDTLFSRCSDLNSHLPDFRNLVHPVHRPEVQSLFHEILRRQIQQGHLNRINNLDNRHRYETFENDSGKRRLNMADVTEKNLPSLPDVTNPLSCDVRDEALIIQNPRSKQTNNFKETEEVKRHDAKRNKLYLQKVRQRALKNSHKHFLTPIARPKPRSSAAFKVISKSVSDLKSMNSWESKRNNGTFKDHRSSCHSSAPQSIGDFSASNGDNRDSLIYVPAGLAEPDNAEDEAAEGENAVRNSEISGKMKISPRQNQNGDRKIFKCPHCRYLTDRKNNLKRHIVTMHQESSKALECCGIGFQSKAALRDHNAIFHRGGYRCQVCSRNFCRKALLRRHLTVHSGQKDFFCDLCGYATSHKSNLERHQKVHNKRDVVSHANKRTHLFKQCGIRVGLPSAFPDLMLHTQDIDFRLQRELDTTQFNYGHLHQNTSLTKKNSYTKQMRKSENVAGKYDRTEILCADENAQIKPSETETGGVSTDSASIEDSVKLDIVDESDKEMHDEDRHGQGQEVEKLPSVCDSMRCTRNYLSDSIDSSYSSGSEQDRVQISECKNVNQTLQLDETDDDEVFVTDQDTPTKFEDTSAWHDNGTDHQLSPTFGRSPAASTDTFKSLSLFPNAVTEHRLRMCNLNDSCSDCNTTFSTQSALCTHD